METAQTILNQLGGNKFIAMTGSKNFVSLGNGLRMNLTKNKVKAKWLKIILNSNDTYTMDFFTADKNLNIVTKAKFENIYCDMLQSIFTQTTGLYTKL
jgi:hypothetical protein